MKNLDNTLSLENRDMASATTLNTRSKASIIHIGSLDSFDITEGGKDAARRILDYLENGKRELLKEAIDIYNHIIPYENFGGEYTALLWLCKFFIASKKTRTDFLSHPIVNSWYDLLSRDDFANLKEYIKRKYHFIDTRKDDTAGQVKLRFLEDFILFNNPDRMRWDKTYENFKCLNIRKGDSIIDFGCGPGYFTVKFAEIVGEKGHVYGIETNEQHINYLRDYINKYHINNVDIFNYQPEGLGLKGPVKADVVYMCSLYHILYAALTSGERDLFIESIKRYLKEDGRFIIVDNDLVDTKELPYHGPYISRELITSQLWHYDFELIKQYQFTPQRYVLEFRPLSRTQRMIDPSIPIPAMLTPLEVKPLTGRADNITIVVTSPASLVRYRMIGASSEGYTLLGKKAARLFYNALEKKDKAAVSTALKTYKELIPQEKIGDEYTAFEWFCKYLLAPKEQQARMHSDKFDAEYFNYWASDDYALLKKYLRIKYDLAKPDPDVPAADSEFAKKQIHDIVYEYSGDEAGFDQLNNWNEFICFNNPNRESWERTSQMLNYINIRDGEAVADVGCGFGFFSFKFSQLAGKNGRVYSTEINKEPLAYVEKISAKYGLNIQTIQARLNDVCLPANSVDTIFMCSMYHAVYIASIEFVKDEFIASLKKALKKGGRLVIVDNAITPPAIVPYHGSGIAKELIIAQLKYYGFHLVDSKQFIPQRYVLIFQPD